MGRVLAIDWGAKRTGLALSDESKIIANELETIDTKILLEYIQSNKNIFNLESIVLGYPKDLQNRNTNATLEVDKIYDKIKKNFPELKITLIDERFSSKIAAQTLLQLGVNKKKRKEKSTIDKISALILLQDYLSNF